MRIRPLLPLLLSTFLALSLLASADAEARSCAPQKVTFKRQAGATAGKLAWRAPRKAPKGTRYRVWRNGKVVGQTRRRSMRVRVSVNRRFKLRVRAVDRRGRPRGCSASLRLRIPYRLPSRPRFLAAQDQAGPTVRLSWEPAARGEARIAAYRLRREGKVLRQVRGTTTDVSVSSRRSYSFTVQAVDRNGQTSADSNAVRLVTGHTGPNTPGGLSARAVSDSQVALSWQPARLARGTMRGYRALRDGRVLGQTRETATTASNLFAATDYSFQVQAVDTLGYVSEPSAAVRARTHDPVPTSGHAHAFLLASTGRSFTDFQAHYRSIGTVYPTYYDCDTEARFTGRDDPLITRWAMQRKVRTLPRFNCQSGKLLNRILNEAELREYWLDRITDTVARHGYDGAMIDFEAGYAADRGAFSSFMAELGDRLHAQGKQLAVAVSAKTQDVANHPRSTFFDYHALGRSVDTIFVMAWGIHWATSVPGAQDKLSWMRAVVAYTSTIPTRRKFVLGMQLYGMDWPNGGGPKNRAAAYEYDAVMALRARHGASPTLDPEQDAYHFAYDDAGGHHDLWYTDAATQGRRIRMARAAGLGGVGFWRLGREDQRLWEDPLLAPGAAW